MNYDEILTFLAIEETKSISKAAEVLFVSQTTVSQRLKALENEIGTNLFVRQRGYRTTELSEKGKKFMPIAVQWRELYEQTQQLRRVKPQSLLAIGCSDSLVNYLLGPFFNNFARENPNIDLKLRIRDSDEIYRAINNRSLDIGILLHPVNESMAETRCVATERMMIIQYGEQMSDKDVLSTKELDVRNEIQLWWGTAYQLWHDLQFDPMKRARIRVNTVSLILNLIRSENAWAIMPYSIAKQIQATDCWHIYDIDPPPPHRNIYLVTHRNVRPETASLIELFSAQFQEYLNTLPWFSEGAIQDDN